MKTSIAGKNLKIGSSMNEYISGKVRHLSGKLFKNVSKMKVVFSKEFSNYFANIIVYDSSLGTVKVTSQSHEIHMAFDSAISRLEKRLEKFRGKIFSKEMRKAKTLSSEDIPAITIPLNSEDSSDLNKQKQPNVNILMDSIDYDMPSFLKTSKANKELDALLKSHEVNNDSFAPG
jgi:ribosomal subunit interface protein